MAGEKRIQTRLAGAALLWLILHVCAGGRWMAQNFCTPVSDVWTVLLAAAYVGGVLIVNRLQFTARNNVANGLLAVYWTVSAGALVVLLLPVSHDAFPFLLLLATPLTPLAGLSDALAGGSLTDTVRLVSALVLAAAQGVYCCVLMCRARREKAKEEKENGPLGI